jgi:hypothetical protein
MSVELDVDAACGASFALDFFEEKEELQTKHYGRIFSPPYYPVQSKNHATLDFHTKESVKANTVVAGRLEKKIAADTKVEGSIDFKVGPNGNIEFKGTNVTVTVSDDKGNSGSGSANYDHQQGTVDVSVSASKESKGNK